MSTVGAAASSQFVTRGPDEVAARVDAWEAALAGPGRALLSYHTRWLLVLRDGLGHAPYGIEAVAEGQVVGLLPLSLVRSRLFGRFLVGLPYLNYGGVQAADPRVAAGLIGRAVELADRLDVRYLELRHEQEHLHPSLGDKLTAKVHMRMNLPETSDALWKQLDPKVRNQVRKGEQQQFDIQWGGVELLNDFFAVFSRNMRDLGTPTFGRPLFRAILEQFPEQAELCVLRIGGTPVASALLTHGYGVTEVPSASSLRAYHATNANMLMYWQLLCRAIQRRQPVFDFGRSSRDSGTFRFKKQWGAQPYPAVWQYYVRKGRVGDMRPDNRKYNMLIRVWRRLPVGLTRLLGPMIVRGIP
jgi:FemAB-related protein (PEP-CTERM system-associated)